MMEKSGCLQLTQEEYNLLKSMLSGKTGELVKFSGLVTRLGLPSEELERILDSGEYRIVED
jgi:hypothetical protein